MSVEILLPKYRSHAQAVKLYEREVRENYFTRLIELSYDEDASFEDNVYLNYNPEEDEEEEN